MAAVSTSTNVENQENEPNVNQAPIKNSTDEATTSVNTDKKEEEITTKTSKDPSNATNQPQISKKTAIELLSEGTKLISDKDYYSASDVLSDALQIIQQKNIANTIESVPYYMAYGEALIRLIQSSNDLFAAPSAPQAQEPQEPEAHQESTPNTDKVQQNGINTKEEQEDDIATDAAAKEEQVAPAAIDTSEDREIAWETLEYARSIMEEYLQSNKEDTLYAPKLALVHSMLGEILIEDENNEQALKEFECALELRNKSKDGENEYRQNAFDRFMACLAAQFCAKDDEALKHCNIALQELSQRIVVILKEFKSEEERKEDEYEALVKDVHDVLSKMDESKRETESVKELKQLVDSMEDLMAKLDEVKSVIEQKKNGKENNTNEQKEDDDVDEDPLARLIKGLTSRFGIDEEQLALMEQADSTKDENKNEKNDKKKNDASNGVTTIGFGTGAANDDDDEVYELGSFGTNKKTNEKTDEKINEKTKEKTNDRKKRSLEEAGIEVDDGLKGNVKKMKLNTGDAVSAETIDAK